MEHTKITTWLIAVLDSIAEEDEPNCFISVFVHLTRNFGENELGETKELRTRQMITRANVYTPRLLGVDATKKGIEELAEKNWVLTINLPGQMRLLTDTAHQDT